MDNKETRDAFGKWLTKQFLRLQSESGRMWTVKEFSEFLGTPDQTVGRWMKGASLPDTGSIARLAKLGNEIYTILGIEIPKEDETTQRIRALLKEIGEDDTMDLLEALSKRAS